MLEIINNHIQRKIEAKISPPHALFIEVLHDAAKQGKKKKEAEKELSELKEKELITVGRTINDYWIKIR